MRIINLDRRRGKSSYLLRKAQRTGSIILTPDVSSKIALKKTADYIFGPGNWDINIMTLKQYKDKPVDSELLIDDLDEMLPKIFSSYFKGKVTYATTTIYMTSYPPHDED